MSRILVIGNDTQVSREIGDSLCAVNFPMEYSAGHADTLQRLRMRSFGVVITDPDSAVDEDLALLEEMRLFGGGEAAAIRRYRGQQGGAVEFERGVCAEDRVRLGCALVLEASVDDLFAIGRPGGSHDVIAFGSGLAVGVKDSG
jgi:hypothetical protein